MDDEAGDHAHPPRWGVGTKPAAAYLPVDQGFPPYSARIWAGEPDLLIWDKSAMKRQWVWG